MDLNEVVKLSREFIKTYSDFQTEKRKVCFRAVGKIRSEQDLPYNHYWMKPIGEFIELAGDCWPVPADQEEPPENIFSTEFEDSKGRSKKSFVWYDDEGTEQKPVISKETLMYVGDWCDLPSLSEQEMTWQRYLNRKAELNLPTAFEALLKKESRYNRILHELKNKNIAVRPHHDLQRLSQFVNGDDEKYPINKGREFELVLLRIIAGAFIVYLDPLRFSHHGTQVGVSKVIRPSNRVQALSKTLLAELASQNLAISGMSDLIDLANGESPQKLYPQIESSDSKTKIKVLVREISLLSKKYLIIKNGKANRFPEIGIQKILELIDADIVVGRTISNYQAEFDGSDEEPLTDTDYWLMLNNQFEGELPF
jgi:hypothetical protein